jgi:alkylation response protein AidB-like acyl-CoA dehydrogenase
MGVLPAIEFENLFEQDPTGKKLWKYWLGAETFKKFTPRFSKMGANGARATSLSQLADRYPPRHTPFNSVGERIDRIEYHPAYLELQQLSYGEGIVALKYDGEFLKSHRKDRHLLGFAIASYFAQTETGLFCPICMTDALGRVLEKNHVHPMAKKALTHISSSDLQNLWQGAMFLTEKQGGSDVGANTVQATETDGRWLLNGDKWFCSNADAQAALVLARLPGPEGHPGLGTKGLGLFLVLREKPQHNHKTWLLHRLKDKLGVRSMASGEITFRNTEAYLIGGAGAGFKIMTEMVNMSRIYNAVSSVSIVRRALMEARAFGHERSAFGKKLQEQPLWRACIADLAAEHLAMMFLVFESTRQLDLADAENAEAATLLRWITPLAKALSGKLAVFAASEAMELIGGNAYIEEHIMPRLLRDAQVLPIWEGTSNIQSLDVLRVMQKESPQVFFKRCREALQKSPSQLNMSVGLLVDALEKDLMAFHQITPEEMQRASRTLLENAGRILSLCLMLEATRDGDLKTVCEAAAQRILSRSSPTAPLGGCYKNNMAPTEEPLIDSIL